MSTGLSNPKRSVMICVAVVGIGAAAVVSGILMGAEKGVAPVLIGVGALVLIVFTLFLFNFIWAVRLTEAMKRGENVIARWTVPPETLEEFRANEKALNDGGRPNDYRLPRKIPAQGLDVMFSPDAVMIGDTFFGLAKTGLARFDWIQMMPGNPLSIAFGMAMTSGRATSSGGAALSTERSELRIPVARTANDEARKVLAHYTSVTAGQTIAKPGFWSFRIKLGLWGAGIGVTAFVLGFALNTMKVKGDVPLILAVTGIMLALFGLVLAGIAWMLSRAERADKRR